RPYSLTFDGGGSFNDSASGSDNALLYVPTGVNDPNVSPLSTASAVQSLIDYVAASGCDYTPGESIKRNTCSNPWHYDLDLRFSQELPFIGSLTGVADDRVELFLDFDNFLNFVDSDANILKFRNEFVDVVDLNTNRNVDPNRDGIDNAGRYIITGFQPDDRENVSISSSAWRIQLGVRYEF
ncbi:MAG: hypothetical protein B7X57_10245, partial [Erythrobacter sp. 34-65-8]